MPDTAPGATSSPPARAQTPSSVEEFAPPSGESISPDTLARHELRAEGLVAPVVDSSPIKRKSNQLKGLQLRTISRDSTWRLIETVPLMELPVWFEKEVSESFRQEYKH